jgi:hypothetical protein
MKDRIRIAAEYLVARLGEQSTWRGIAFLVALSGSKFGAGLDWGEAAGLSGLISALMKIIFPDSVKTAG